MPKNQKEHTPLQLKNCPKPDIDPDKPYPYSNSFEDIYFNQNNGVEESDHVFINANHLKERWTKHKHFTIAEVGFGTGLNFLNTWKHWDNSKKKNHHLHYVSAELYPLEPKQIKQKLQIFKQLKTYTEELLNHYPETTYGFHLITFPKHNLTLTLLFGDATECYQQWEGIADAWYLDGFSPKKNHHLWNQKLFAVIAQKSRKGSTLSTFTAASEVRSNIQSTGFEIKKIKGYAQKREMITAQLTHTVEKTTTKHPWHPLSCHLSPNQSVAIIGAGIAALCIAKSCQQRGIYCQVIDPNPAPLSATSSLPLAIIKPHFSLNNTEPNLFYWRAFQYAIQNYPTNTFFKTGTLIAPDNKTSFNHLKKTVDEIDLKKHIIELKKEGIYLTQSGYVDSQKLAKKWSKDYINKYYCDRVQNISYDNKWQLYNDSKELICCADSVIIAAGIHSKLLINDHSIPLDTRYGQISICKSSEQWPYKHNIMAQGYMINDQDQYIHCGSTYEHIAEKDWFKTIPEKPGHWQKNKSFWANTPYHKLIKQLTPSHTYSGIRVFTPDRMPLCGPVIDTNLFKKDYSDLHHGRHWKQYTAARPIPHLYIMTGLGSRGFTTAPILAEILAALITETALPIENQLYKSIHPNRFLYRSMKKKQQNHS